MRLYRTKAADLFEQGSVVAIGNFEGLHIGHQAIITKLVNKSKALGLPSVIVTFEPSPKQYFIGKAPVLRLMTLAEKLKGLRSQNIDTVICLRFNHVFSKMSHEAFVQDFLLGQLKTKHLIVGDDFRFGANRSGDVSYLRAQGKAHDFGVESLPEIALDGVRVSSTSVRNFLTEGNVSKLERILGRPFSIVGAVRRGDQRGRLLGFPTANLNPPNHFLPKNGVYYVRIQGLDKTYHGVTNLGVRPTVDGTKLVCETHIFDFSKDIYGKKIKIEFIKRIREEKRFDSLDALRFQIDEDIELAKTYIGL